MTDPSEQQRKTRRLRRLALKKYPPQFISELANEFAISNRADLATLTKVLHLAAWVYLDQKSDESDEPKLRNLTMELAQIERRANKLANTLNYLSEPVTELLWAPLRHVPIEYFMDLEVSHYFGYPVARHRIGSNAKSIIFPNEHQITKAIWLISNLANHALRRTKPDKGGRPKSEALRMWVINMQRFWEKQLGRRFTYNQHKPTPIRSAFLFCQKALRPIDNSISAALLGTTIRTVIKETPKAMRVRKSRKPT